MAMLLAHQANNNVLRDEILSSIVQREQKGKGYTSGLDPYLLYLEEDSLHDPFGQYFHYSEISAAIDLLADLTQDNEEIEVQRFGHQKPFYELFTVDPADLESTRLRAKSAPMLNAWEEKLLSIKDRTLDAELESTQLQLINTDLELTETFKNLQSAAAENDLERIFGLHIQAFKLKRESLEELLRMCLGILFGKMVQFS